MDSPGNIPYNIQENWFPVQGEADLQEQLGRVDGGDGCRLLGMAGQQQADVGMQDACIGGTNRLRGVVVALGVPLDAVDQAPGIVVGHSHALVGRVS